MRFTGGGSAEESVDLLADRFGRPRDVLYALTPAGSIAATVTINAENNSWL